MDDTDAALADILADCASVPESCHARVIPSPVLTHVRFLLSIP
jgi:hypothetical protein